MTQGPWQEEGTPQQPYMQGGQQPLPVQGGSAMPPDPDGFFTPAHPRMQRPAPPAMNVPPPYQGGMNQPPPPQPANYQDPDSPPDDRMVFRAPPRGKNLLTWLYLGLGAVIVVLIAIALSQRFGTPEQQTAVVTISEQGTTFSGQVLIVRNESVFQQENVSDIVYLAEEASGVSRGDPICTVYSTGFSARELERLMSYREQIKDYHKVLLSASTTPDSQLSRLESAVMQAAQETQSLVRGATGNLLNQEQLLKEAITQRHNYLKQKLKQYLHLYL